MKLVATLLPVVASAGAQLAETGTSFDLAPLINLGGIGAVLAFVLMRLEPRLRSMESAIDRNSRANLLVLLSMPQASASVKAQAEGIVAEIKTAEDTRSK